jgi:hypothetical protein
MLAPAAPRPTAARPDEAGRCPSLQGFRVAANGESIGDGEHRWLLHEALNATPSTPIETSEEHPIAEPEARARGASSSEAPVWLLNDGAAPCRMKPAGFVLQRDATYPQFERVVRVLEGACPHNGSPGRTIAFQQADEPARCRLSHAEEMRQSTCPAGSCPRSRARSRTATTTRR